VEDDLGVAALVDEVLEILGAEGRVSAEERVGDDAEGPHVDRLSVALLQHHFGRRISKGAGHGGENLVLGVQHLGDAKVGEDEIRVGGLGEIEQVLGFEI
jgi:hypothetical protein